MPRLPPLQPPARGKEQQTEVAFLAGVPKKLTEGTGTVLWKKAEFRNRNAKVYFMHYLDLSGGHQALCSYLSTDAPGREVLLKLHKKDYDRWRKAWSRSLLDSARGRWLGDFVSSGFNI